MPTFLSLQGWEVRLLTLTHVFQGSREGDGPSFYLSTLLCLLHTGLEKTDILQYSFPLSGAPHLLIPRSLTPLEL